MRAILFSGENAGASLSDDLLLLRNVAHWFSGDPSTYRSSFSDLLHLLVYFTLSSLAERDSVLHLWGDCVCHSHIHTSWGVWFLHHRQVRTLAHLLALRVGNRARLLPRFDVFILTCVKALSFSSMCHCDHFYLLCGLDHSRLGLLIISMIFVCSLIDIHFFFRILLLDDISAMDLYLCWTVKLRNLDHAVSIWWQLCIAVTELRH